MEWLFVIVFIVSLMVNLVLSIMLQSTTRYNGVLIKAAKERIKHVNSLVKQRNHLSDAYSKLKYDLKNRVHAAPALGDVLSDNYSPHAGCKGPKPVPLVNPNWHSAAHYRGGKW